MHFISGSSKNSISPLSVKLNAFANQINFCKSHQMHNY